MAYSVMVWLVNPGEYPQEVAEELIASAGREDAPGARTGANIGYSLPRLTYGVYESEEEANAALDHVTKALRGNMPLRVSSGSSSRVFLIPAQRVHYVVCQEVQRPKD